MKNNPIPRLDLECEIRDKLLPHCRLKPGEIWVDPLRDHKVACMDATNDNQVSLLMDGSYADLAIQDPPYNLVVFEEKTIEEYIFKHEKAG